MNSSEHQAQPEREFTDASPSLIAEVRAIREFIDEYRQCLGKYRRQLDEYRSKQDRDRRRAPLVYLALLATFILGPPLSLAIVIGVLCLIFPSGGGKYWEWQARQQQQQQQQLDRTEEALDRAEQLIKRADALLERREKSSPKE